jgi:hypothetical protein
MVETEEVGQRAADNYVIYLTDAFKARFNVQPENLLFLLRIETGFFV